MNAGTAPLGTYTLTVTGNEGTMTHSAAVSLTFTATTTTLFVAPASGTYGSFATLTANLLDQFNHPVGGQTVSFSLNGKPYGSGITDGNGNVLLSASIVGINGGIYPAGVTASFAGSANYAASAGANSLTVNKANTATSLISSANPSVFGQAVTFTATVAVLAPGSGTPTGFVRFLIDGLPVVGGQVDLSGGSATLISTLPPGSHTIIVNYSGDANYISSTAVLSQTVKQAIATISINNLPGSAVYGGSFTPMYTYNGDGTTFSTTSSTPGTCTVSGGVVNFVGGGACTVMAHAAAGTNYAAVDGSAQSFTIGHAAPTVAFTGAPVSAPFGATFSVTATTNATTTAAITASGACSIIGNTVKMTSGTGACNLTATWPADINYSAAQVMQNVNASPATLSITASSATMIYGGPVPAITPTYTGLLNGATATMTPPSCSPSIVFHFRQWLVHVR